MTRRTIHAWLPLAALLLAAAPGAVPAQPAPALTSPPVADDSVYRYTTVRGDTLIGIGRRLLADPAQWPQLARANGLKNPNRIATSSELLMPLKLLRQQPVAAAVLSVAGNVRSGAAALAPDGRIDEGSTVNTGPDGQLTIRLVDGTVLRLRPDSELRLSESHRLPDIDAIRSRALLGKGRVEVEAATARGGRPGFRIETPQGVLGVRGTEFRVATGGPGSITYGEVLHGVVTFSGPAGTVIGSGRSVVAVSGGYGSLIGATGTVQPPVPLLPAPAVDTLPVLQERLLLRFPLAPLPGAVAYRGQIALDAEFDRVLADLISPTPELRFAGLPDGRYRLRVRGIDARGLEGRDAEWTFTLKARPEPPLPSTPPPRAVLFGSTVDFNWAANPLAQRYELRLASEPAGLSQPLRRVADLQGSTTRLEDLPPGVYRWQLRSVRDTPAGADPGPWGEVRSFELRPMPPAPPAPTVSDSGIGFAWEGTPGQQFDFELARDAAFTHPLVQRRLTEPAIDLPLPGSGRFHVRLRTIDPDGFVGPWTGARYFDVPNCVRDGAARCVRRADGTLDLVP